MNKQQEAVAQMSKQRISSLLQRMASKASFGEIRPYGMPAVGVGFDKNGNFKMLGDYGTAIKNLDQKYKTLVDKFLRQTGASKLRELGIKNNQISLPETAYWSKEDLALRERLVKAKEQAEALFSGSQFTERLNDPAVQTVFKDNKPMTWQEYIAKSQEGYSAKLSDGKTVKGKEMFKYITPNDGSGIIKQLAKDYETYVSDHHNYALNFQNSQMQNAQLANETDPSKRNEVANYGSSPVGASGWSGNSVQSGESFNDTRRRSWGQDNIQGV